MADRRERAADLGIGVLVREELGRDAVPRREQPDRDARRDDGAEREAWGSRGISVLVGAGRPRLDPRTKRARAARALPGRWRLRTDGAGDERLPDRPSASVLAPHRGGRDAIGRGGLLRERVLRDVESLVVTDWRSAGSSRRRCRCRRSTTRSRGRSADVRLAALSSRRSAKLRYDGIAIAVRIPRMMMTTRSSIRVKPCSSRLRRLRSRRSCEVLLPEGLRWLPCLSAGVGSA